GQHPSGGQDHLDELDSPGRAVGHVRRGSVVADHDRQQRLPVDRVRVDQVVGVEPPAPHRYQGRRLLRPLCSGARSGQAQGDREGIARVHGRQDVLEHHLGLAVLHGRPAVDEGLHVQRRVRGALRQGVAGQVIRSLLGLLLGTTMVLGLARVPVAEAQTPKRGGTLRVSYGNEIAHLDFHTAPGYEMIWVSMNVGCGLVNITPDGKFVPDAAESWQVSPDGLLYTFKLRKNAVFHDRTKLDAAAVKFSIDRLKDPETKSGMRPFWDPVHSVEVIDPQTVQVRLKHPYAFFLHMIAAYRTGLVIYNPVATQKYTLEDRKQGKPEAVSGCGPF